MKEWPLVPLGKAATEMQPGFACQPTDSDEGLPQLRTNNVSRDGRLDLSLVKRVPAKKSQVAKYSLRPGDVLFNNTNSPELVGKTALFDQDQSYLFSNHMTRIRVNLRLLEPGFLARFLHKQWEAGAFRALVTQWVSQAAINRDQLGGVAVPLPPLSEQRRIVEILDQADHLRRLRTEANTKADRILPALFLKMFGDPATNPMGWPTKPLTDVVESLEAGWSAKGEARTKRENEYGVLKVSAVTSRVFRREEHKAVAPGQIERELVTPKRGDLLFSRANTRELVAATCIVEADEPHLFLPDKLWRVNLRSNRATAHFLHQVLGVPAFRDTLRARATGTSGSMLNVPQDVFLAARAPIPPIDLQTRFSKAAWKVLDVRRATAAAERRLLELWGRVLCRAFSGDLTESWRKHHEGQLRAEMRCQAQALAEAE